MSSTICPKCRGFVKGMDIKTHSDTCPAKTPPVSPGNHGPFVNKHPKEPAGFQKKNPFMNSPVMQHKIRLEVLPLSQEPMILECNGQIKIGEKIYKIDLLKRDSSFITKDLLGTGAYGTVHHVEHQETQTSFAVKTITVKPENRKTLLNDVTIIKKCFNNYIVSYYGLYADDLELKIFMERMKFSLLDMYTNLVKLTPPVRFTEEAMGVITCSVLQGLQYLMREHKVMHRDIKPSNILCGNRGQIKLCDFGISKQNVDEMHVNTFVGCQLYLPPERCLPTQTAYDISSDVWALGITLVELACLSHPFQQHINNPWKLVVSVVEEAAPTIPDELGYPDLKVFVSHCLQKKPLERSTYERSEQNKPSLMSLSFYKKYETSALNIAQWYDDLRNPAPEPTGMLFTTPASPSSHDSLALQNIVVEPAVPTRDLASTPDVANGIAGDVTN